MLTVASGVAKHSCGKAAILLAYDLQSKLKDFIRSINPLNDLLWVSDSKKVSKQLFRIMDRLLHIFGGCQLDYRIAASLDGTD
jgi:hypothetical protein